MAKTPAKSLAKSGKDSATNEAKLIAELAKILKDTDLTEIEMEKGDLRIRVARAPAPVTVAQIAAAPIAAAAPLAAAPAQTAAPLAPASEASPADDPNAVKSPMVGTAYLRANPESDAFVKVGDTVKEGDTLLLIEAMKTFNPIKASRSGTVTALLVDDGQPVEFGEALLVIS
ncbi:MAG: acetyl-CoA carboxylase, biotin carboxyl carrier protein [Robiginitomaculum sp.]|nr:MAG: acetyl-CoA carboxylase, biotin carboxyl carrier protein [Robiginitomaculum sp.]